MNTHLFLADGTVLAGTSFGANVESDGEVVFTTGMTGYLEILTDPSYFGQIVVFTFPLIGNYGVFDKKQFFVDVDEVYESSRIWVRGVIVAEQSEQFSHALATGSFGKWLKKNDIPALAGIDTRALTQVLREHGTMLGHIGKKQPKKFSDELGGRFVPHVSPQKIEMLVPEGCSEAMDSAGCPTVAFIDCGAKNGIFRNFLKRGVRVVRMPFDQNPFELKQKFDGVFFSNGPGDPEMMTETVEIAREALQRGVPTFGICLGCQMLGLAVGGKTRKMKYGHRGVNQPVQDVQSGRCLITTQNHGFEVDADSIPDDWEVWFENLNDGSVEGIRHKKKPFSATQFHPEACAGPEDAEYLFDEFLKQIQG